MSAGLTAVRRAASLLLYASLSNVSMVASMTAIKVRTCGVSSAVALPAAVREVGARTGGRAGDGGGGKLQSTVWQSQPLGLAPKMPPTEQLGGGGGGDGEGGGDGGAFGGNEGGSGGRGWEQCAGMLP